MLKATISMLTREVPRECLTIYPACHKWRHFSYKLKVSNCAHKFTKSGRRDNGCQSTMSNKKQCVKKMLPTKGEAYELFWRAKVPLKMIMDQLQMSKSTLLRLLCYAKENPDSLSSPGKRELAWRTPRSWTSPSGTWRCACRCHQQGGKPYQVLASRAVHPMGPFQGQNRNNKEIVNLIYMCGVNLQYLSCTVGIYVQHI